MLTKNYLLSSVPTCLPSKLVEDSRQVSVFQYRLTPPCPCKGCTVMRYRILAERKQGRDPVNHSVCMQIFKCVCRCMQTQRLQVNGKCPSQDQSILFFEGLSLSWNLPFWLDWLAIEPQGIPLSLLPQILGSQAYSTTPPFLFESCLLD